jgi:four helix bundle protein
MSNTTNNQIKEPAKVDIHERIYDFVVRVIMLAKSLPKTQSNVVIISQILRSATSMGANDQEADGTLTKKDFIHCCTLVRKESKETNFWLRLISDTNPNINNKMGPIIQEGQEIAAIISSIINKTRQ